MYKTGGAATGLPASRKNGPARRLACLIDVVSHTGKSSRTLRSRSPEQRPGTPMDVFQCLDILFSSFNRESQFFPLLYIRVRGRFDNQNQQNSSKNFLRCKIALCRRLLTFGWLVEILRAYSLSVSPSK